MDEIVWKGGRGLSKLPWSSPLSCRNPLVARRPTPFARRRRRAGHRRPATAGANVEVAWSLFFSPKIYCYKISNFFSQSGPPTPPMVGTYLYIYIYLFIRTHIKVRTYIMFVKWTGLFWIKCKKLCVLDIIHEKVWFIQKKREKMWTLTWFSPEESRQSPPTYHTHPLPPV